MNLDHNDGGMAMKSEYPYNPPPGKRDELTAPPTSRLIDEKISDESGRKPNPTARSRRRNSKILSGINFWLTRPAPVVPARKWTRRPALFYFYRFVPLIYPHGTRSTRSPRSLSQDGEAEARADCEIEARHFFQRGMQQGIAARLERNYKGQRGFVEAGLLQ